jgi:hypothetical protein
LNIQEAFLSGFVKRAQEYGLSNDELLKLSADFSEYAKIPAEDRMNITRYKRPFGSTRMAAPPLLSASKLSPTGGIIPNPSAATPSRRFGGVQSVLSDLLSGPSTIANQIANKMRNTSMVN